MTSLAASVNEFSGVPVFLPDQQPEWQRTIDDCHPLLRPVALVGVSAVQAGIESSDELKGVLQQVSGSQPLLGDTDKVSSPLFGPIYDEGGGFTRMTSNLPESSLLIVNGLYTTALAKRLSLVAQAKMGFAVIDATDERIETDPAHVGAQSHRRLYDFRSNPYFRDNPLDGILAGHSIKTVDTDITDIHAADPGTLSGSTEIDMQAKYYYTPDTPGKWTPTHLFATLGVEISEDGLVAAKTDNGMQRGTGADIDRQAYRATYFGDLGRYAHYFGVFPIH